MAGKRYILVGGAPRSGTTLLQNILDSHPDIVGGPEFMHLRDFVELRKTLVTINRLPSWKGLY